MIRVALTLAGLLVAVSVLLIAWTMAHAEPAAPRSDCYRAADGLMVCRNLSLPQAVPPVRSGDIPLPKPRPPADNGISR
jgi:hypothetical protein